MEFEQAAARIREGSTRPGGIGILQEKSLHATLKLWLDEDTAHHEVVLPEGCVADLYDGERITEIQTGNFPALRGKLERLLPHYQVTVVYPLIGRKWLRWIHPETGEMSPPRRSPRVGTFADSGRGLVFLLPLLGHPHLTVRLVLVEVEEHRLADGWSRDGKRGSHRVERMPLALQGEVSLTQPADYRALLPEGLAAPFTAAAFGRATWLQGRALSGTLKVLLTLGVLTREKQGRAYLYRLGEGSDRSGQKVSSKPS